MVNKLKISVLMALLLMLASCDRTNGMAALQAELSDIRANSVRPIAPLRKFTQTKSHLYSTYLERSPFETPKRLVVLENNPEPRSNVKPPKNHEKTDLEKMPINVLQMLGVIKHGGTIEALMSTPKGRVHRVTKGMYLGENFGKVVEIGDDSLTVMEIVPNGANSWVKAPRTIYRKGVKAPEKQGNDYEI